MPPWKRRSDLDDPLDHDTPSPKPDPYRSPLRRDPQQPHSREFPVACAAILCAQDGPPLQPPSESAHQAADGHLPPLPNVPVAAEVSSAVPDTPPFRSLYSSTVFNTPPHQQGTHDYTAALQIESIAEFYDKWIPPTPPPSALDLTRDGLLVHDFELPSSPPSLDSAPTASEGSISEISELSLESADPLRVDSFCHQLSFYSEYGSVSEEHSKERDCAFPHLLSAVYLPRKTAELQTSEASTIAVYSLLSATIDSADTPAVSLLCSSSSDGAAAPSTDAASLQQQPTASSPTEHGECRSAGNTATDEMTARPTAQSSLPAGGVAPHHFSNTLWCRRLHEVTEKYARVDLSAATPTVQLACRLERVRTFYVVQWSDEYGVSVEHSDDMHQQPSSARTFANLYQNQILAFTKLQASQPLATSTKLPLLDFMCDLARVLPEVAQVLLLELPSPSEPLIGAVESTKRVMCTTSARGVEWHTITSSCVDNQSNWVVQVREYEADDGARALLLSTPEVSMRLPPSAHRPSLSKTTLPETQLERVAAQHGVQLAAAWLSSGADRRVLIDGSQWPFAMVESLVLSASGSVSSPSPVTVALSKLKYFEILATSASLEVLWQTMRTSTIAVIQRLHDQLPLSEPFPALTSGDFTALSEPYHSMHTHTKS